MWLYNGRNYMQAGNLTNKLETMNEFTNHTNLSNEPPKPGLTYSFC